MDHRELRFQVRRFCNTPLISAEGDLDGWQFGMLSNLLKAFKSKGHSDLIIDMTKAGFAGTSGREALIKAMKMWNSEMEVHLVATGEVAMALSTQSFPFSAHHCASLDEAAEYICWSSRTTDDYRAATFDSQCLSELPLAA